MRNVLLLVQAYVESTRTFHYTNLNIFGGEIVPIGSLQTPSELVLNTSKLRVLG